MICMIQTQFVRSLRLISRYVKPSDKRGYFPAIMSFDKCKCSTQAVQAQEKLLFQLKRENNDQSSKLKPLKCHLIN